MRIDAKKIRPDIFRIAERLAKAGFKSYLVGGAVRDIVFGNEPKDFDVLTDARCADIARVFRSVVPYGMKHGTVIVVMNKTPYDVTSYNEGDPAPMSLENDLAIRDFTINAMACELKGPGRGDFELIDLFGGMDDYRKKEIKCVPSPRERFAKDPLRILRAVRQAAKFGFSIEAETFETARRMAPEISRSAPERIMSELVKFFEIKNCEWPKHLGHLTGCGVWREIFVKYFKGLLPAGDGTDLTLNFGPAFHQAFGRLAASAHRVKIAYLIAFSLFRAAGNKVIVYDYKKLIKPLFDLKFSKPDFDGIAALVYLAFHRMKNDPPGAPDAVAVRQMMAEHREMTKLKTDARELFLLLSAFCEAAGDGEGARNHEAALKTAEKVVEEKDPVYIEDLAIGGNDIMPLLGVGSGAKVGEALRYAQREVIKDASLNDGQTLKKLIAGKFR